MHLRKVISGGQDGADFAGLLAARICGLETGGTAPKGYRVTRGDNRISLKLLGLEEHEERAYPPRTRQNVKDADATFRMYEVPNSPGERLTLRYINELDKPWLDLDMRLAVDVEGAAEWLWANKVQVLNVAGNSEETVPGITYYATCILIEIFQRLRSL